EVELFQPVLLRRGCPDPKLAAKAVSPAEDAGAQFIGGAARERRRQDRDRVNAVDEHQLEHAQREHGCLATAWTRDEEEGGAFICGYRALLVLVCAQFLSELCRDGIDKER